jgi:hypothetical protein
LDIDKNSTLETNLTTLKSASLSEGATHWTLYLIRGLTSGLTHPQHHSVL